MKALCLHCTSSVSRRDGEVFSGIVEDLWRICGTFCAIVQLAYFSPWPQKIYVISKATPSSPLFQPEGQLAAVLLFRKLPCNSLLESLISSKNFIKALGRQNLSQIRNSRFWSDKLYCDSWDVRSDYTESQNHRIVGVGRDLCGSSSPTLLLKQGHLQQAAQDLVQAGLEYL